MKRLAAALLFAAGCRAPEPAAALRYRWTETVAGGPISHEGGVVFIVEGDRVTSRAWHEPGEGAVRWPPVVGTGTVEGNAFVVDYRSAAGRPEHDFYVARCRFELEDGGRTFTCRFLQRTAPDAPLSPGAARGVRDP